MDINNTDVKDMRRTEAENVAKDANTYGMITSIIFAVLGIFNIILAILLLNYIYLISGIILMLVGVGIKYFFEMMAIVIISVSMAIVIINMFNHKL